MCAANAALIGNREASAHQFIHPYFAVACFFRQFTKFFGELEHGLFVHVANNRNNQTGFGVHRDANMIVLLEDNFLGNFINAGIENRMLFECIDQGLEHKHSHRQMRVLFLVSFFVLLAQLRNPADVRFVELSDTRDCRPRFGHPLRDGLAHWSHRTLRDRTPL